MRPRMSFSRAVSRVGSSPKAMRHLGVACASHSARNESGGPRPSPVYADAATWRRRAGANVVASDASLQNGGATFVAIYVFDGYRPVVHESAFVHPQAAVTGNVVIGRDVYVGPGAAIRADWGEILIADGCNVQEGCVIHVFPGATVMLDESAHIGHGAIIHGATIGRNTLVGMNAVVMDRARAGAECVIGALTFVPAEMEVPDRKVVVGNPARVVKDVTEEMVA